jgi:hypothetical protein
MNTEQIIARLNDITSGETTRNGSVRWDVTVPTGLLKGSNMGLQLSPEGVWNLREVGSVLLESQPEVTCEWIQQMMGW